jgi:hypothetical protein
VSSRCSPETSCYSSSSNISTSKLCLILRKGWAQRMEMLPTLKRILLAPSIYKNKALQSGGRTHAHGMLRILHCGFIAQRRSELSSLKVQSVLFIAEAVPWATSKVMTLSPRDNGNYILCIIKGDCITPSDSRRPCRLCINNA